MRRRPQSRTARKIAANTLRFYLLLIAGPQMRLPLTEGAR